MANLTREELVRLVGTLDDKTLSNIQQTGAGLKDVIEAKEIATGKGDIVGTGETVLPGVVREVLTILEARATQIGRQYHDALLDPSSAFEKPADVLSDTGLSDPQKTEILRRWEYDAREISVAEDEGMPATDGRVLREVLLALEALGAHINTDRSPPTKQGGLDRHAIDPTATRLESGDENG